MSMEISWESNKIMDGYSFMKTGSTTKRSHTKRLTTNGSRMMVHDKWFTNPNANP